MEFFTILLGIVLVNHYVFSPTKGMLTDAGAEKSAKIKYSTKPSIHMAAVLVPVFSFSFAISSFLDYWIFAPLELRFLVFMALAINITTTAGFAHRCLEKIKPELHRSLGDYFLQLLIFNCLTLSFALQYQIKKPSIFASIFYGLCSAIAFGSLLVVFAIMRERFEYADLPKPFRGAPIGLITAGLVSLAFMGLLMGVMV